MIAPPLFVALAVAALSPAPAPQPPDPPLRGPDVPEQVERSLIDRNAMGRLIRIEGRPEAAGIALATLDPERRDRARRVVEQRAAAIRALLVDNIDLVKAVTDAKSAGRGDDALELVRGLFDRFDPDHERFPLMAPLAEVLTPEEHAELARLVRDYWEALVAAESGGSTRDDVRRKAEDRLVFSFFRAEVGTGYDTALRPFRDKLERIYRAVDATPEQRAALGEAVIDHIREARLTPTPAQRSALARRLYEALDEERRIKLVELALAQL